MKFLKYILFFVIPFILMTAAVVAYFVLNRKLSKISVPSMPSIPSVADLIKFSRFSLEKAPSQALVGSITSMTGEINYEPRLATESAKLDKPRDIQQGEILETGADGNLAISFKDTAAVVMDVSTKVNIAQTLPANIVFVQTKGTAEYKKLSQTPVSIRALHLLIENGENVKVSFDDVKPVITVVAASGSSKVAYNNLNTDTRVIDLNEGETLIFNDVTRRAVTK